MATKSKKVRTPNPTLHGLLISRTLSGSVVRVLLFGLLTGALITFGSAASSSDVGPTLSGGFAVFSLVLIAYAVFDVAYIIMANVRPLHPRLDRVILPASLVFALGVIYAPLFVVQTINLLGGLWLTGAIGLLCVLGTRLALLIASTGRR